MFNSWWTLYQPVDVDLEGGDKRPRDTRAWTASWHRMRSTHLSVAAQCALRLTHYTVLHGATERTGRSAPFPTISTSSVRRKGLAYSNSHNTCLNGSFWIWSSLSTIRFQVSKVVQSTPPSSCIIASKVKTCLPNNSSPCSATVPIRHDAFCRHIRDRVSARWHHILSLIPDSVASALFRLSRSSSFRRVLLHTSL